MDMSFGNKIFAPRRLCVGDRAGSARFVLLLYTDVGGDGSGGCFSAAAGQPHHSITS